MELIFILSDILRTKHMSIYDFNSSWQRSNHIETSLVIYSTNQWAGFCIIGASVMKELTFFLILYLSISSA